MGYIVCVGGSVSRGYGMTVRRANRVGGTHLVCVRGADSVEIVAARVVTVMASAVAARKSEERHRSHAGGAEYHTENVEVHLSLDEVARILHQPHGRCRTSPDGKSVTRML